MDFSCFNTSYVSVQDIKECVAKESGTSFNTSYVSVQVNAPRLRPSDIEFQYILCVGSRDYPHISMMCGY